MELILAILVAGPVGFFTETRQRGLAIYLATINVDGTGQRRLTRTAALETNPVWSPDGRRIAFTSDRHAKRGPVHRRQEHPPAHAQPGPRPPAAAMRPVSANFIGPGT